MDLVESGCLPNLPEVADSSEMGKSESFIQKKFHLLLWKSQNFLKLNVLWFLTFILFVRKKTRKISIDE